MLHGATDPKARNNLGPDPDTVVGIHGPCGDEAGTNGHEQRAKNHERSVVSDALYKTAGHDRADDD